jgi:hypothetical protein
MVVCGKETENGRGGEKRFNVKPLEFLTVGLLETAGKEGKQVRPAADCAKGAQDRSIC